MLTYTSQLSFPSCSTRATEKRKKPNSLLRVYNYNTFNSIRLFWRTNKKKSREWTISRKMARLKEQDIYWSRQKNKRRDEKGESKDSPEISDRAETSDIPKEKLPSDKGIVLNEVLPFPCSAEKVGVCSQTVQRRQNQLPLTAGFSPTQCLFLLHGFAANVTVQQTCNQHHYLSMALLLLRTQTGYTYA